MSEIDDESVFFQQGQNINGILKFWSPFFCFLYGARVDKNRDPKHVLSVISF